MLFSLDIPGEVQGISVYHSTQHKVTKVVVTSSMAEEDNMGANKLVHFDLPDNIVDSMYMCTYV